MNTDASESRRDLAAREAAEWLGELRQGPVSLARREAMVAWLRESPLHVSEFLRVSRAVQMLDQFKDWHELPALTSAPDNVVAFGGDGRASDRESRRPGSRRVPWPVWAAAAIALPVLATLLWVFQFNRIDTLKTSAGERREVTLEDGSLVTLASNSEVRVRFTELERDLDLVSGEAFFRVHKNPKRPFVVDVRNSRVRAVGTAFGVRLEPHGSVVTVIEGVVSVNPDRGVPSSSRETPYLLLGANQQVRIAGNGAHPQVSAVNGSAEIAWTAGELVFDDEPLSNVVRRFNAFNKLQIFITDPALALRRVSGVFRATDPESFVSFIQSSAGEPVHREGNGIYVGGSAAASPAPAGN